MHRNRWQNCHLASVAARVVGLGLADDERALALIVGNQEPVIERQRLHKSNAS
jgi:hypothetical protein